MIKESLYKILGLPNFASMLEIKKAFRELAFKHHPDKGGDPEKMKLVSSAYDILSRKKSEYDARLRQVGRPVVIIKTYQHQTGGFGGTTNTTNTGEWSWTFRSGDGFGN